MRHRWFIITIIDYINMLKKSYLILVDQEWKNDKKKCSYDNFATKSRLYAY